MLDIVTGLQILLIVLVAMTLFAGAWIIGVCFDSWGDFIKSLSDKEYNYLSYVFRKGKHIRFITDFPNDLRRECLGKESYYIDKEDDCASVRKAKMLVRRVLGNDAIVNEYFKGQYFTYKDFLEVKELGITPIQFHIHRDEGHYDSATKEWKPNLHAHIVFDCTCREHRLVERPAKFSKEMKSKNGKPPTKLIDNYGKIVRLSKADMSRMQDLASIATGMERGVASDKVRLDAQRYKAQVIAEEVRSLEQTRDDLGHTVRSLEGDIAAKEKEMKRIDVLSSLKKTITSVFDKAADGIGVSDRVKALEQQVADGQARLDAVIKDLYTKAEVSRMLEEKDNVLQRYKTTADQTLNSMQKEINHLKSENRRLLTSLYDAAKILLTRFTSEAISIFEKVGLPGILGQRIWNRVKEYEDPREDLGQKNGKGMKM